MSRKEVVQPHQYYSSPSTQSTGVAHSFSERPAHLRQRSVSNSSSNTLHNPFGAVMMSSDESKAPSYDNHTAVNMRGDKAEFTPKVQHLYSYDQADDAARVLRSKASSISSKSAAGGSATQQKYDLATMSPGLFRQLSDIKYTRDADDALHDPGPLAKRFGRERLIGETDSLKGKGSFTLRGFFNIAALVLIFITLITLFVGLPVITTFTNRSTQGTSLRDVAAGIGTTNSSGQIPQIPAYRGLIDKETPQSATTRNGFDGRPYQLVFSDEFNTDGRTFYPGDDPYWEASDLHYHQTNNIEWYDPANIETKDGYLAITLSKESLKDSHNLGYLGGMLTSWNQFCFTGGYVEVAISLPGDSAVQGLWPAAWTLGNLGRAGYGGSLDGNWPWMGYDSCDVGTLPNQTDSSGNPRLLRSDGDPYAAGVLSYLPGQRLSACTCPGENHPGPVLADGSFPGRSAAEIDIFEAQVDPAFGGLISQSAQWAPFNAKYVYDNSTASDAFTIFKNPGVTTVPNSYLGGVYQQATSALSSTDPLTYNSTTNFASYGVEITPSYYKGFGTGKITWSQKEKAMWEIEDRAMKANAKTQVGNRAITGEPLYLLLNLGASPNFGFIDFERLVFPAVMRVDYVRVYQRTDQINIGCDPPLFPTADYIAKNLRGYQDPNITVLGDMGQTFPRNRLTTPC